MFQNLIKAFKIKEVRNKIFITLLLLLVYRIGCYVPVPGLGGNMLLEEGSNYTFLQLMSAMTGGALMYGTLFAMGIGPYINASIIVQLLTVGIPRLEQLSKQGEEGRKKIENITRGLAMVLAVAQSIGILIGFRGNIDFSQLFCSTADGSDSLFLQILSYAFLVIIYTSGTALTLSLIHI